MKEQICKALLAQAPNHNFEDSSTCKLIGKVGCHTNPSQPLPNFMNYCSQFPAYIDYR